MPGRRTNLFERTVQVCWYLKAPGWKTRLFQDAQIVFEILAPIRLPKYVRHANHLQSLLAVTGSHDHGVRLYGFFRLYHMFVLF